MLSHDLARALLARRNNDVRIEVILSQIVLDKDGEVDDKAVTEEDRLVRIALRDHIDSEPYVVENYNLIGYNHMDDTVVIKASIVSYYTQP
jgi:hypothetical protein